MGIYSSILSFIVHCYSCTWHFTYLWCLISRFFTISRFLFIYGYFYSSTMWLLWCSFFIVFIIAPFKAQLAALAFKFCKIWKWPFYSSNNKIFIYNFFFISIMLSYRGVPELSFKKKLNSLALKLRKLWSFQFCKTLNAISGFFISVGKRVVPIEASYMGSETA